MKPPSASFRTASDQLRPVSSPGFLCLVLLSVCILSPLTTSASPVRHVLTTGHHSLSGPRSGKHKGHHHMTVPGSHQHRKSKLAYPCGLAQSSFDHPLASLVARSKPTAHLYKQVMSPARKTKLRADKLKHKFLKYLNEDNFEVGLVDQRQDWLPDVPSPSLDAFLKYDTKPEDAFKESFILMQYFVVGIEQILMDIVLHDGHMLDDFTLLQEDMNQIMQEICYSMHDLGIAPQVYIRHDVMSHRFRDLRSSSRRHVRDYLILRDFILALDFVQQLFAHLRIKERRFTDG
ncbi:hypothetical protein HDE_01233 [Halotydeus destructor]|nr:hypothetical protein HDE_01233 [Halotydeus destructor]